LEPVRDAASFPPPFEPRWYPPRKFQHRTWLHVLLFVLTALSTTIAGASYYANFITEIGRQPLTLSDGALIARGAWFSVTLLAILLAHEFGHYFACRYYDVDASLPYFLPLPLIAPTGTLGAVIRIREPIASKRVFFDVGIAGPIAGFVVAVGALVIGLLLSDVVPLPTDQKIVEYADPPIIQAAVWLIFGSVSDGYSVNLHPIGWASWWGFFITALNLFPVGQLDGGHIAYGVLGKQASILTIVAVLFGASLTFLSPTWIGWTVVIVVLLLLFGRNHPRTFDESVPLDRTRLLLALFALAMFVLSFAPATIQELN
jgi:membrane-associated protease RseP (regulator of RpoE activity)